MDLPEILKVMPLRWRVVHWIVTISIALVMMVLMILAVINPLWFRRRLIEWIFEDLADGANSARNAILGGVYEKYSLLERLKEDYSESDKTQR